ncbi:hypothetical protein PVAND_001976 [Polypedilum vanderplanki]|uniref:Uncharacterized protein n=1 Tax=Polypedilum vanderplanki TaxID=319348 RepID=A0A9J6BPK3_POLVA|nr:hypothetical protein PVAND_001976 [Polypedilum vanderplanki]
MEYFKSVLISKLKLDESVVNKWCNKIEKKYNERPYHNLQMLAVKMNVIKEDFSEDDSLSNSLIIASIFQYFHYDVKESKNEENCEEFQRFVEETNIENNELVDRILQMLRDDSESEVISISIFKDLDLVVLGLPTEEYNKYTKGLKEEFSSNDESYKRDRLKMLKTLLTIPYIYSTPKIRDRFESTARQNIKMEIDNLEA